jgi:hypothetical protein
MHLKSSKIGHISLPDSIATFTTYDQDNLHKDTQSLISRYVHVTPAEKRELSHIIGSDNVRYLFD